MKLTNEQRKYIKRRLRELNGKKPFKWGKLIFAGCILLLSCTAFTFKDKAIDVSEVKFVELKFVEEKVAVLKASYAHLAQVEQAQVQKASINFGCTPEKKEVPKMVETPKPEPKPEPVVVKPVPKKVEVAKAVIYKVKKDGNTWTVKTNKSTVKNLKVRIYIGYCYYEGIPDKNGNTNISIEWYPPNQTKIGVGVVGTGGTLASAVIPMP